MVRDSDKSKLRLLFVVPSNQEASGGNKQIYRMVDVLNSLGYNAFIVLKKKENRLRWFKNQTPYVLSPTLHYYLEQAISRSHKKKLIYRLYYKHIYRLGQLNSKNKKSDLYVFPEFYGTIISDVLPHHKKVIYVQGCYLTFFNHPIGIDAQKTPYLHKNTVAAIVNSVDGQQYFRTVFPDMLVKKVRHAIDHNLFKPAKTKKKQIAYMSRKNYEDARQVINYLALQGILDTWTIRDINGVSHEGVAQIMGESSIFLSTNTDEGFSLPAVEAMSSGCMVIGYTGKGGREFFLEDHCFPIPEKETQIFMKKTADLISNIDEDATLVETIGQRARSYIIQNYNDSNELKDMNSTWKEIVSRL